jgi:hypothetical protein
VKFLYYYDVEFYNTQRKLYGCENISTDIDNAQNLNKEELLFLHLLDFHHFKEHFIVPDVITEQGIHKVIQCDLGHLSRLLTKNEKKGNIFRELLKIENKKRKQNAFFF